MNPLPISVVIVTWRSAKVLPACFDSLERASPPPAEIIVVDNASDDGTREWLAGRSLRLICNAANLGFAAAANRGIAEARQPFVFLLNPDVRVEPDMLANLHSSLDLAPGDVVAAGGKLRRATGDELLPTDVIDSTGIVMTFEGRHFDRGADEPDREQWDALGQVFGITGAAALFRRDALLSATVDGEVFDEDFFAYREDADLAWRLRGFGFRALYDPEAIAYHRRTVTPERRRQLSREVNFHSVKNRFLLRLHHADFGWWWRGGWRSVLRDLVVIGACFSVEWSSARAFPWLARNFAKHWRRRRQILARRCVPSTTISDWFI